jgi:hypothetical protein
VPGVRGHELANDEAAFDFQRRRTTNNPSSTGTSVTATGTGFK